MFSAESIHPGTSVQRVAAASCHGAVVIDTRHCGIVFQKFGSTPDIEILRSGFAAGGFGNIVFSGLVGYAAAAGVAFFDFLGLGI